jgi:hypothetical protein
MAESATPAVAFMSWGVWVANCPNYPACTNAMALEPGQTRFNCWVPSGVGVCGTTADVVWPSDVASIESDLDGVPPQDQDWSPGVPE